MDLIQNHDIERPYTKINTKQMNVYLTYLNAKSIKFLMELVSCYDYKRKVAIINKSEWLREFPSVKSEKTPTQFYNILKSLKRKKIIDYKRENYHVIIKFLDDFIVD